MLTVVVGVWLESKTLARVRIALATETVVCWNWNRVLSSGSQKYRFFSIGQHCLCRFSICVFHLVSREMGSYMVACEVFDSRSFGGWWQTVRFQITLIMLNEQVTDETTILTLANLTRVWEDRLSRLWLWPVLNEKECYSAEIFHRNSFWIFKIELRHCSRMCGFDTTHGSCSTNTQIRLT